MSDSFSKVHRHINQHAMLKDARGVVVAVSGGPDSIALLDMLVRWREARVDESNTRLHLHVAHLNHKLRGADADEDTEFVGRLAESLGLPATVECVDVRAVADRSRRGIEEMAREVRYEFLLRVARATASDRIATGHTLNDQAETFLMRLARGAGTRGLAAMRPVRPAHEFAGQGPVKEELLRDDETLRHSDPRPPAPDPRPLLIRPLLAITRDDVEAYCNERRLNYRIDASNAAADFTRNRVRREVLPALQAINPQVVTAIARAAEHLAADEAALNELAKRFLDMACVELRREADGEISAAIAAYAIAALREPSAGLRQRMLLEAIRRAITDNGESREITAKHIAAVESLLEQGASGKHLELPGGLAVWREFATIIFKRRDAEASELAACGYRFELSAAQRQVEAGGLRLAMERGLPAHQLPALIRQARQLKEKRQRDWLMAVLDDDALPAVLLVRPRRRGERVRVSGHRQTIKLKKLMIDHTIPVSRRAAWPIVTTPDDRYVWSPGLPPAVDFAARDETHRLAIVRALNI